MPRKIPQIELVKSGIQIYRHAMEDSFKTKERNEGNGAVVFTSEELAAEHGKWETFVLTTCDKQMAKKSTLDREVWQHYRAVLQTAIQKQYPIFCELNDVKQELVKLKENPEKAKEAEELNQKSEAVLGKSNLLVEQMLDIIRSKPPPSPAGRGCAII